jgi:hypothetical protein
MRMSIDGKVGWRDHGRLSLPALMSFLLRSGNNPGTGTV